MSRILLLAWMFVLAGCVSTSGGLSEAAVFSSAAADEVVSTEKYKIGPGDVLTISVWGNPDLTLSVPVRPDGFISMPLVGDIKAEDTDADGLAADITVMLENQLRNPQVTVVVSQINSSVYTSRVRVTGAVRSPLSLPYARGMSVLDIILEAGGINEVASPNKTRLYRIIDEKLYEVEVRLDDILLRGQLETNYPLKPGDVITVPERLF